MRQETRLSSGQMALFSNILGMTNEQLFAHLKEHEGKGKEFPGYTITQAMGVQRHLDVWVSGGLIREASSNYLEYAHGNTEKGKSYFHSFRWMLQMRERFLKVATSFILRYQHGFFWGNGRLAPISVQGAVNYINDHLDEYGLDRNLDYSMFFRVLANKRISIEGREFEMRFFFTTKMIHPDDFGKWLRTTLQNERKENPHSDQELVHMFLDQRGITIARRTVTKYRKMLGIDSTKVRRNRNK